MSQSTAENSPSRTDEVEPAYRSPIEPMRREQILEAALQVFAVQGFSAATIKQLAAAAGLKSSALLYHYYPNKEALFEAVVIRFAKVLGEDAADREQFDQPPDEFLTSVMSQYLDRFRDPNTLLVYRVLLLEVPRLRAFGENLAKQQPGNIFTVLEEYFAHQNQIGALDVGDPTGTARAVVALMGFNIQSRFSALLEPPPPDDVFIEQTVDLLLAGLRPR